MKTQYEQDEQVKKPKFKRTREPDICYHCHGTGDIDGFVCDHCDGYGEVYV